MRTLLIVMRRESARSALGELLADEGYEVLSAAGAHEAIEIVDRSHRRVDALIVDEHLVDADGVTLATDMRQRQPGLQVLLATGAPERPPSTPLPEGAVRIGKPLELGKLLAQLERG